MEIKRDKYLRLLNESRHNGMIKIITGVRRCGKSYLLFKLFYDALKYEGIDDSHIIRIDLEDRANMALRDPDALMAHIDASIADSGMHYVLIDEVQHVSEFEDVLNSYLKRANVDVYVTGSNSRFLSTDVITEFRGRGDEIRVHPLSFAEFLSVKQEVARDAALMEYITYGGLPQAVLTQNVERKEAYLKHLFAATYLRDVKERHAIRNDADLESIVDIMASTIGGLTNPSKLRNTFLSVLNSKISSDTIKNYLGMLQDAFIIEKAVRYDIKGKKYIDTPCKYYFEDLGLRNARLNFRQLEETHLMENLIYNELRIRGMAVDVGQVVVNGKNSEGVSVRKTLEVDFVCNRGFRRYYIQSAFDLPSNEKMQQEMESLLRLGDNFKKIIIRWGMSPTYMNDDGILIMNIFDFLLKEDSLDM